MIDFYHCILSSFNCCAIALINSLPKLPHRFHTRSHQQAATQ
ncbi:hypothetical protein [Microcoleus sp. LEGE 07076]|nr:hypothetical protein [Microcoleus sp. LEGE 07076]